MSISAGLAIYFVLWWVVLFAVLPFGVRSQYEAPDDRAEGADAGAPVMHRMGRKVIATTIISALLFAVGIAGYRVGLLNIDWLSSQIGLPY